jgi:cytochrome c oxidase subunit 3
VAPSPAASGRRRASRSSIPGTCRSQHADPAASGTTVTWAHHALLHNDRKGLSGASSLTVLLGVLFTIVQAYEYIPRRLRLPRWQHLRRDLLHGDRLPRLPRLVGTIFLLVCLFRAMAGHFTPKQHFGFEAAAWYWHFVDVVWLFLFAAIYIWASDGN